MSTKASDQDALSLGAVPRADLLPPEVRRNAAARTIHRALALGVVGVLALVVVGSLFAGLMAAQSRQQLSLAQAETQNVVEEQSKYVSVRTAQQQVDLVKAAQSVGASTEIDWVDYLNKVQATLPQGMTISSVDVVSATPLTAFQQSTAPLQGTRIAAVTFTASSQGIPQVSAWLNSLQTLPGFVDATPSSLTLSGSGYTVTMLLHINENAFDNRFSATKGK